MNEDASEHVDDDDTDCAAAAVAVGGVDAAAAAGGDDGQAWARTTAVPLAHTPTGLCNRRPVAAAAAVAASTPVAAEARPFRPV